MKFKPLFSLLALVLVNNAFAGSKLPVAPQSNNATTTTTTTNTPAIKSDSATGSHQTTVIDANGNLKMMEPSKDQASEPVQNETTTTAPDSTSVTSPGMSGTAPAAGANTAPRSSSSNTNTAPSIPHPPQPLYGTVGGSSVYQQGPVKSAPVQTGSTMSTSSQTAAPNPPPATPNKPIGNAAPMIPNQ